MREREWAGGEESWLCLSVCDLLRFFCCFLCLFFLFFGDSLALGSVAAPWQACGRLAPCGIALSCLRGDVMRI